MSVSTQEGKKDEIFNFDQILNSKGTMYTLDENGENTLRMFAIDDKFRLNGESGLDLQGIISESRNNS